MNGILRPRSYGLSYSDAQDSEGLIENTSQGDIPTNAGLCDKWSLKLCMLQNK